MSEPRPRGMLACGFISAPGLLCGHGWCGDDLPDYLLCRGRRDSTCGLVGVRKVLGHGLEESTVVSCGDDNTYDPNRHDD